VTGLQVDEAAVLRQAEQRWLLSVRERLRRHDAQRRAASRPAPSAASAPSAPAPTSRETS